MNDDQVLHALHFDDSYEVKSVLADGPGGLTELVFLGDVGPFVRKKMSEKMASRGVWSALSECECRRLPQVVATYELPDYFVVVYDYVPGETLESLVAQRGRLSVDAACGFALDVCEAAEALHSRNIVHRDITPANIIVAADGAHLMDLGIARFRVGGASKDTEKLGTFGFASPEQFGFAQTDARSDVYSIGRLLGYMLTGVRPDDEGYEAALDDQAKVPAAYRAVVDKASAFEPSSRYQSAAELAEALRVAAAGGNPASIAGVAAAAMGAAAGAAATTGATPSAANAAGATTQNPTSKPESLTAASTSQQASQAEASNESHPVNPQQNLSEGQPSESQRRGISNMKKLVIAILFILVVGLFIMIFLTYFLGHATNSTSSGTTTQAPAATTTQNAGSNTGSSSSGSGGTSSNKGTAVSSGAGHSSASTVGAAHAGSNIDVPDSGITVTESSWWITSSGYLQYVYCIRNDSADSAYQFPQVSITAKAADGTILFSREDTAGDIGPGGMQFRYGVGSDSAEPATVEFKPLVAKYKKLKSGLNTGSFSVSNISVAEGSFGGLKVTGSVSADDVGNGGYSQVCVFAVFRDSSGNIVYGNDTFVDCPQQGSSAAFELQTPETPEYATCEVHAFGW